MIQLPQFAPVDKGLADVMVRLPIGKIEKVVGLLVESAGPPAAVGEWCQIEVDGEWIDAEVVGFRNSKTLLMPLGELGGIRAGLRVVAMGAPFKINVGPQLIGRILDGLGRPLDGLDLPSGLKPRVTNGSPPSALSRPLIETAFETGVRAIDGFLTIGQGQRMGIFAGSGVGKSTLLGMIARNCLADVNVVCLVGERGRELREFIENDLGAEGLARSVVICATSDQPALVRIRAAFVASTIAEYFRDQGSRVMLMMDSVTRFAMAQREVGLSVGEPPSTKGYTPSVFALLPKLLERAGNSQKGSITALYTVLVDGDDTNEPIADATRSILDGHIVLDRKLTSRGFYPPIDQLASLSRTMPAVVDSLQLELARKARESIATYRDNEDLISIGAYKAGTNRAIDRAIALKPQWDVILRQKKEEATCLRDTVALMKEILNEEI